MSNNHQAVVDLLVARKDFDPDVQVRIRSNHAAYSDHQVHTTSRMGQDGRP